MIELETSTRVGGARTLFCVSPTRYNYYLWLFASPAKLANAVWASNNKLVSDVSIFDVFEGKNLGQNQKSVAMSVTLQPLEKTLTDEEIETVAQEIIASVKDLAGGQLRE